MTGTFLDIAPHDVRLLDAEYTRTLNRFDSQATITVDDPNGDLADTTFTYGTATDIINADSGFVRFNGWVSGTRQKLQRLEVDLNQWDWFFKRTIDQETYSSKTISTIVEDLIKTYTPIKYNSNKVSVTNDVTIDEREFRGETVNSALEELASYSAGEDFGVDSVDEFYFRESTSQSAPRDYTSGSWFDHNFDDDYRREVNKVIVYYGTAGQKVVAEDSTAQSDLANSLGAPRDAEIVISRHFPQITQQSRAQDIADSILERNGDLRVGTIWTWESYDVDPGETTRVVIPQYNIDDTFVISRIKHRYRDSETEIRLIENTEGVIDTVRRTAEETTRVDHKRVDGRPGIDAEDDGTAVVSGATGVNFGTSLDVTDDGDGTVTVDGSGGGVDVEDDGTVAVSGATVINVGNGISASQTAPGEVVLNNTCCYGDGNEWGMTPQNDGFGPAAGPSRKPNQSWSASTYDVLGMTVGGGRLNCVTRDPSFVSLDLADGSLINSISVSGNFNDVGYVPGPVYDPDTGNIFFTTANGSAYAVDPSSGGSTVWSTSFNDPQGMKVDRSQVYLTDHQSNGDVRGHALDKTSGSVNWQTNALASHTNYFRTHGAPTITADGDVVFSGWDDNPEVIEVRLYTKQGSEVWSYSESVDGSITLSSCVSDGKVFVATLNGGTYKALDLDDGKLVHDGASGSQFLDGFVFTQPSYYAGNLYLPSGGSTSDTGLYAVNGSDGTLKWSDSGKNYQSPGSALVLDNQRLYIGDNDGVVRAYTHQGTTAWTLDVNSGSTNSIQSNIAMDSDGALYFCESNTVYQYI